MHAITILSITFLPNQGVCDDLTVTDHLRLFDWSGIDLPCFGIYGLVRSISHETANRVVSKNRSMFWKVINSRHSYSLLWLGKHTCSRKVAGIWDWVNCSSDSHHVTILESVQPDMLVHRMDINRNFQFLFSVVIATTLLENLASTLVKSSS